MAKTDNPHAMRQYDSLASHINEQAAERITHKIPLSKSANIEKKFLWAETICADLQNEFDDDTIKVIRMDCACGPDAGKMNSMKRIYEKSADMADFVSRMNTQNQGFVLRIEEDTLLLTYPQCYCSCVKRVNKPLSKIWCYCTLGYTKRMFEYVLDREVDVELLDSVKVGGKNCVIKIRIR